MIALVDYDNIEEIIRRRGILEIVSRTIQAISRTATPIQSRVEFRLYGGWFWESRLSKQAQELSLQINSNFPATIPWGIPAVAVKVSVVLAQSLAASPGFLLTHTFRRRPFSDRLYCDSPSQPVCGEISCPMHSIRTFFTDQKCPSRSCIKVQSQFLYHYQQKLVDTMLAADLIYFSAQKTYPLLAVVSSDDDMWPGIRTAIAFSSKIVQVHTRRSPNHSNYCRNLGSAYIEETL
jgi:hypothetical protein